MEREMQLLPPEQQTFKLLPDGRIVAGLHEHGGSRWHTVYTSVGGDDLAGGDDLEFAAAEVVDRRAVR